jgi:hypothetical protein
MDRRILSLYGGLPLMRQSVFLAHGGFARRRFADDKSRIMSAALGWDSNAYIVQT